MIDDHQLDREFSDQMLRLSPKRRRPAPTLQIAITKRRHHQPQPEVETMSQRSSGRSSNGVDSTTVVRVETFAAARISWSSSSRSAGLVTRTLRM
jgi:hypothetical protein